MACNVNHPDLDVRCIAGDGKTHDHHYAMTTTGPVEWPNTDWVAPPPRKRTSSAKAADRLKDLADRVPPRVSAGAGGQGKVEGIANAESGTDPAWAQRFDARVRELAGTGKKFTSEDVTSVVGLPPGHPNAIGARMNSAARRGLIKKVGYTEADRETRNAAIVAEWQGV